MVCGGRVKHYPPNSRKADCFDPRRIRRTPAYFVGVDISARNGAASVSHLPKKTALATSHSPWTSENWLDLLELIGAASASRSPSALETIPQTTEEVLSEVKRHPIGKWLYSNTDFRAAQDSLTKTSKLTRSTRRWSTEAELVFVGAVVYFAGLLMLTSGRRSSRGPTQKVRQSAVNHIDALLDRFGDGVSLANLAEQSDLENKLTSLRSQQDAVTRARYGGLRSRGSSELQGLASFLFRHFDLSSPAIILRISRMTGVERDYKTRERYVKAARRASGDKQ